MNILDTLYFPDTIITTDRQFPIFLLFNTVHILHPVEPNGESGFNLSDPFMISQFCQPYTPHPLGKDRARFLSLLHDIQKRKDDYAAQLSNITLASLSAGKRGMEDTGHAIASSLRRDPLLKADQIRSRDREELWQARLVLKIGEILDTEEEEVVAALLRLEEDENTIFARLHGDEDEDEDDASLLNEIMQIKSKLKTPAMQSFHNRLRAWLRLAQDYELPQCLFWSTRRKEIADILIENHERRLHRPPTLLAEIPLPASTGREMVAEKITSFREGAAGERQTLFSLLSSATGNITEDQTFADFSGGWQEQLNLFFPVEKFGRSTVQFYSFEDTPAAFAGMSGKATAKKTILAVFDS